MRKSYDRLNYRLPSKLTLSGKDSSDARAYQENDVTNALERILEAQKEGESTDE